MKITNQITIELEQAKISIIDVEKLKQTEQKKHRRKQVEIKN